jgi:hypothetical protein
MGYRAILAYHQIQNIAPQKHRGKENNNPFIQGHHSMWGQAFEIWIFHLVGIPLVN